MLFRELQRGVGAIERIRKMPLQKTPEKLWRTVELIESRDRMFHRELMLSNAIDLRHHEFEEIATEQRKRFKRRPIEKRLRRASEHGSQRRFRTTGKDHFQPVLANVQPRTQRMRKIRVGRGSQNLRFVHDQKQRLRLGIEGLERVG